MMLHALTWFNFVGGCLPSGLSNMRSPAQMEFPLQKFYQSVVIVDVEVGYYVCEENCRIAVAVWKLKNISDRTINRVDLSIYFLDSRGMPIDRRKFIAVDGEFLACEIWPPPGAAPSINRRPLLDIPPEWAVGNISCTVIRVDFADSVRNEQKK